MEKTSPALKTWKGRMKAEFIQLYGGETKNRTGLATTFDFETGQFF